MSIEPLCDYCNTTTRNRCRSFAETETCPEYKDSVMKYKDMDIKSEPIWQKGGAGVLGEAGAQGEAGVKAKVGTREQLGNQYTRLVPLEAIAAGAASLEYGATKYQARNWEYGLSWQTMIDSLKRHVEDFERGSDYDDGTNGSGLHQTCMIMASAMMLCASVIRNIGEDDRVKDSLPEAMSAKDCLLWMKKELESKELRLKTTKADT